MRPYLPLCLTLLLAACPVEQTTTPPDMSTETPTDMSGDLPVDASSDAPGSDAGLDQGPDQATDTTPDVVEDVSPDVSQDMADAQPDMPAEDMEPDMAMTPPPGTCDPAVGCAEGTCEPVADVSGSWHTCVLGIQDPGVCNQGGDGFPIGDACCMASECSDQAGGACVRQPLFFCGGAFPMERNECMYDECQADADCNARPEGLGVCVQAGAFREPVSRCVYGGCREDADCGARAGGACTPFTNPCNGRFDGFHCTYDDSVCRQDDDCKQGGGFGIKYCASGPDGMTACRDFQPPP